MFWVIIIAGAIVFFSWLFLWFEPRRRRAALAKLESEFAEVSDKDFIHQCKVVGEEEDRAVRLRRIIAEATGVPTARIHADTPLADLLATGFDGGDGVELVVATEREFGIEVSDEEAAGFVTPRQLLQFVTRKMEENTHST